MEHRTVKTNNGIIHYWMQGDSQECIIFTHGMTMDHKMFNAQMEYFSASFVQILGRTSRK